MKNRRMLLIAPPYYGMDTSIARGFERHGLEPLLLNARLTPYFWESVIRRLTMGQPWWRRAVRPLMKVPLLRENQRYITTAEDYNPAFIFIIKGDTVLPETLMHFRRKLKIRCMSYQWDDPFYASEGQNLIDECRGNNFGDGMGEYEHIFAFDTFYVRKISDMGYRNVSYLPLATDEEIYQRARLSEPEARDLRCDVCFVGAPCKDRVATFNALTGFDLAVFGDGWGKYAEQAKWDYIRGTASGDKVLKLYGAAQIVLNIHHPQSICGVNTRTFDIPSCGAFEITDYKEDLPRLFDIGEEIVCYRNPQELPELIHRYLTYPENRKKIADKGLRRVRDQHTWYHRVGEVMKYVG